MSLLPDPSNLGLPSKFSSWRKYQDEAVYKIFETEHPAILTVIPTGGGKSLAYITASILQGGRTAILTSSKGLQSQLYNDFSSIGLADVRGRNSYKCINETDGTRCDQGMCMLGLYCPYKENGCLYYDRYKQAKNADRVSTNYAYWMTIHEHGEGLGKFDFLVCDEVHDAPAMVSSFLSVTLDRTDSLTKPIMPSNDMIASMTLNDWCFWAKEKLPALEQELEHYKERIRTGDTNREHRRRASKLKRLVKSIELLTTLSVEDWAMSLMTYSVEFCPINPAKYCKESLFFDIPKILLTSASVREKTAEMLGLDDFEMVEYPHVFPVENRLLTHVETIKLSYRSTERDLEKLVHRVDQILKTRLDRNSIVQSISYARRDLVVSSSKYSSHMLTHRRRNTERVVQSFKSSPTPVCLVSPSVTTGYDFPDDECRLQIILKVPYPDTRSDIIKARRKEDKDYVPYIAAQQLVQMVGRGTRSKEDWCENIIIDDNIVWFMKQYERFMPKWFVEAYRSVNTIPQARRI